MSRSVAVLGVIALLLASEHAAKPSGYLTPIQ